MESYSLAFYVWLISLSTMFLEFAHTVARVGSSLVLRLNHVPLRRWMLCLSLHPRGTDVWVVSASHLLGTVLPRTFVYKYLFEDLF